MWKRPDNIADSDWPALTKAWDARKDKVYERFEKYTKIITHDEIDGMMAGLLGIYYNAETHAQQGKDFHTQLRDEFQKGVYAQKKIVEMREKDPALREPAIVHYGGEVRRDTLADKCMGGIVQAFIEITKEVFTERFGAEFEGQEHALRNGVLERSSWRMIGMDYKKKWADYVKSRKSDPEAKPPDIYRQ